MEGLTEPLDRRTGRLLRRAVLELATHERRRAHPPTLHVGVPGGPVARLALHDEAVGSTDPGLRTDLVAAMRVRAARSLERRPPVPVWLTRPAPLTELQDVDLRWLAAARAAYAEAEVPLVMVLVDRHGWYDPRSGVSRTWVRLRGARR